ncbi:MAG: hypothetical protein L0Y66_23295 [Myxococcaceae bacterium]|nr:hypothetical protein [Myxococcaceae bacterium]MCI0670253.1 hypothetical protein [Myxococcaceae bacterium]
MGLLGRLLGKQEGEESVPLVAKEALEEALTFQVLLPGRLAVDEHGLGRALRAYDAPMAEARVELTQDAQGEALLGLVGWGRHVIRLVGFHSAIPEAELEWCYGPAHLTRVSEARVREHHSYLLLLYAGDEVDALEQSVALAAVAGALVVCSDALVVLNEAARAAVPARMLTSEGAGALERLRTRVLPLLERASS